jgi:hypothetical protein
MVEPGYKELKAGDVRRGGDEVRRREPHDKQNYTEKFKKDYANEFVFSPVESLLGHKLLASDLMVFEFRRPLI